MLCLNLIVKIAYADNSLSSPLTSYLTALKLTFPPALLDYGGCQ